MTGKTIIILKKLIVIDQVRCAYQEEHRVEVKYKNLSGNSAKLTFQNPEEASDFLEKLANLINGG